MRKRVREGEESPGIKGEAKGGEGELRGGRVRPGEEKSKEKR